MRQEQDTKKSLGEEISLKELLITLKEFWVEVWSKKIWIIGSILIAIGVLFINISTKPVIYKGKITFIVDDDNKRSIGGVSSILGQFGLGGGQSGGNLHRILELSKSRAIVQRALFEEVEIEDKKDYLANHIILNYDYHDNWEESTTGLKKFLFEHDSIVNFDEVENKVLKELHEHIIGSEDRDGILSSKINEESGIMSISTKTLSQDISFHLIDKIYLKLTAYYASKAVEKQQTTYNLFKNKTDSIQQALNLVQYQLSKFEDSNRNLTLRQYQIEKNRLELELQKLIVAYGESYKSLELADFALQSQTPFIQIIDAPLRPLERIIPSKRNAILSGFVIGLVLSVFIIVARKFLLDTVSNSP